MAGQYIPHEYIIVTQSIVYAPFLSNLKFSKQRQIQQLLECYKSEVTDNEELEKLSHIDRAFDRIMWIEKNGKFDCQPIISGTVLTKILREITKDDTINVRGFMQIPKDRIAIDVRIRNGVGLEVSEVIMPATSMSAIVYINKKVQINDKLTSMGARKTKGYGQIRITVKPLKESSNEK